MDKKIVDADHFPESLMIPTIRAIRISTSTMWFSKLSHNIFELFIGVEQVLVYVVYLGRQLNYLTVRLVNQFSSRLEALLPSAYAVNDLIDPLVDFLVSSLPLVHFLNFYLGRVVVVGRLGLEAPCLGSL